MEIIANDVQLVVANQNVLFTDTVVKGNKWISHRQGSGLITLKGLKGCECDCQPKARYLIMFSGNIAVPATGTAGEISLTISLDGEPVASTRMAVTPTAVSSFFNIASSTYVEAPNGCCSRISVENTSDQTISVENANLIAVRVV